MVNASESNVIYRDYTADNYRTIFNKRTGFFARIEKPGYPEPFWSSHGPELIDISITGWCDKYCHTCYRSADKNGKHMSVFDYRKIIHQAANMEVIQVALGGGNPNQHPEFIDILKLTRGEYGIVPNYTTNGRGLTEEVINATREYCGAVAVSAYEPYEKLAESIKVLIDNEIKINIHYTLDEKSIEKALNWIYQPPDFLFGINAIIFLNYKPVGRGRQRRKLARKNPLIKNFMSTVLKKSHPFKVGFDSCMVSGLASQKHINPIWYDSCEAARFSMYISEDLVAYPCSFMETTHKGVPVAADNLLGIWQRAGLFCEMRNSLMTPICKSCKQVEICRGGCPIFSEINLCEKPL